MMFNAMKLFFRAEAGSVPARNILKPVGLEKKFRGLG